MDAGVPRVASALVKDQVARGWDVIAASPQNGDLARAAQASGARWQQWEATRTPGPSTLAETRKLAAIIKAIDPDLVHLHSAKAGVAGRIALRGKRPTVFQPHAWSFEAATGALQKATVGWERTGARWADVIVCVSDDERHRGEEFGVKAKAWEVIPNGVDLEQYPRATDEDRTHARAALDLNPSEPIVVLVGRLARQKGQDTLLKAWPTVLKEVPDARLVLVGDGPDLDDLKAMNADRVVFAGDTKDVAPWFAAASITTIPSRWEAGLSLVAMEAMARGRSVVATDVAGMKIGIGDAAGEVVPIDDPPALATALAKRLADPDLARREGDAARARVEERYDVRVASQRMADLYGRIR